MTGTRDLWDPPARLVVGLTRRAHRYRAAVSLLGLLAILAAGSGYLLIGILDIKEVLRIEADNLGRGAER